ncbi:hypothetical protein LMG33810_000697 [Carnimonas sp. LMG 33810]
MRNENDLTTPRLCRGLNTNTGTFIYNWRSKQAMKAPLLKRMKKLQADRASLNQMYIGKKIKAKVAAGTPGKAWGYLNTERLQEQ